MTRTILLGGVVTLLAVGCVNPRSIVVGQTARMMGSGNLEVGVATGAAWDTINTSTSTTGGQPTVTFPSAEANVAYGLSDGLDLNLHASTAGLQPGVKLSLGNSGLLSLAVLPSVAGGFYAGRTYVTSGGATSSTPNNAWTLMGGVKVLASVPAGFYGALGYDFQVMRYYLGTTGTGSVPNESGLTSHHLDFAFGYELKVGELRIRPEFAFSYSPAVWVAIPDTGGTPPNNPPGTEFLAFPNVTIAFASGGK